MGEGAGHSKLGWDNQNGIFLMWRPLVSWIKPILMACGNQTMRCLDWTAGIQHDKESPRFISGGKGRQPAPRLNKSWPFLLDGENADIPLVSVCRLLILRTQGPVVLPLDQPLLLQGLQEAEENCTPGYMEPWHLLPVFPRETNVKENCWADKESRPRSLRWDCASQPSGPNTACPHRFNS